MEFLSNIGEERLGDALAGSIDEDAKLSIISSYFTVFAYGELKDALSKVEELRFVFSEPTFVKRMQDAKEPMEFELRRRRANRASAARGWSSPCATTSTSAHLPRNARNGSETGRPSSPPGIAVPSSRAAHIMLKIHQVTLRHSTEPLPISPLKDSGTTANPALLWASAISKARPRPLASRPCSMPYGTTPPWWRK